MGRSRTLLLSAFMAFCLHAQPSGNARLSPLVRQALMESVTARRAGDTHSRSLTAFVQLKEGQDDGLLRHFGCQTYARTGDIVIAAIPLEALPALSQSPGILRIEAGKRAQALMDTVPHIVSTLPVYEGAALPQAFTGDGVVVGVMDIGFDLTHPNFYSDTSLSHYRIGALWDQLSPDTIGSSLPVGRDYIGPEAVLALQHVTDGTTEFHGTHTLGIAAGSGYGTPYRGVAFDSDICLVSNAVTSDNIYIDPADYYRYTTATDALGFKYLFDYADRQGKPCVASFSEGYQLELSQEDSLFAAFLDHLDGPGHIIVVAAGNENAEMAYAEKPQGVQKAGAFIRSYKSQAYYHIVASGPMTLTLHAYEEGNTPTHTLRIPSTDQRLDSLLTDTLRFQGSTMAVSLSRWPSGFADGDTVYLLQFSGNHRLDSLPHTALVVEGTDSRIAVYGNSTNALTRRATDPQWDAAQYGHNILSPACFPSVICAGATSHRLAFTNYLGEYRDLSQGQQQGRRMKESSTGPSANGLMKPDVTAPGYNIISSFSSFYIENNPDAWDISNDVAHFQHRGRTYAWNASSGTSMACPVVAGTIALWLQAKPTLTRQDILDVFSRTCTRPDPTLTYPNNQYGYGEIDAYAGLLDILGLPTVLPSLPRHQPAALTCRLAGQTLYIDGLDTAADVTLYDLSGRPVLTTTTHSGRVDLSTLPKGLYAVEIKSRQPAATGSQLIRL